MIKLCPNCKKKIHYKTVSQYNDSIKYNRMCRACASKLKGYCGPLGKECVNCNTIHIFSNYQHYKNSSSPYYCKCCVLSKIHKGKKISDSHKNTLRTLRTGKLLSSETRKKISEKLAGTNNPCYGRCGKKHPMYKMSGVLSPTFGVKPWNNGKENPFTESTIKKMKSTHKRLERWKGIRNPNYGNHQPLNEEHRRKLRVSLIRRIEKIKLNGHQLKPNFNITACKIIDDYGKQNGYKFQHAMNGGEFHIKDLGYFVDGYDKDKNVVIDYYENNNHHYDKYGNMKEKDIQRIDEIKRHLNCVFVILEEKNL